VREERVMMDNSTERVYLAIAATVVLIALSALTAYLFHANEVTQRMDNLDGAAQTHYIDVISNGE
jgi:hypothetical protein